MSRDWRQKERTEGKGLWFLVCPFICVEITFTFPFRYKETCVEDDGSVLVLVKGRGTKGVRRGCPEEKVRSTTRSNG